MTNDLAIVRKNMGLHPTDIPAILTEIGVPLELRALPHGESSRFLYDQGGFRIVVNAEQCPQRQAFAAAHELAHYLIHRDLAAPRHIKRSTHVDRIFSKSSARKPDDLLHADHDKDANRMAISILMPLRHIETAWSAMRSTKAEKIRALANMFAVSEATMAVRVNAAALA